LKPDHRLVSISETEVTKMNKEGHFQEK